MYALTQIALCNGPQLQLVIQVEIVMKNASSIFAASSTSQLALGGRNLSNIAINAPQLLSAPLYYTVYNTRPFDVPVYGLFSNHCFFYGFTN